MTSTSGGTGLGYASMSSSLYAARPTTTMSSAAARIISGIRSAAATIRWIMVGSGAGSSRSQLLRQQDRAAHDDLLPDLEAVPDLEPLARLALVHVDGESL